jgi:allantoinase
MAAWGGISSLQLGLPVLWTEAKSRGFKLADICRWLSASPAKRVGLGDRKGQLAVGYDADLIIFDPEAEFIVEPGDLRYKVKISPYIGRRLRGCVKQVVLGGQLVDSSEEPKGRFLLD